MEFFIALPIILISITLILVGNFTNTKFLVKISKLILIIVIVFLIIEYLIYIDFDISNIKKI